MRPRVFITRKIAPEAVEIIARECDYEIWDKEEPKVPRDLLLEAASWADGLQVMLSDTIDPELMERGKNLKVVADTAVGYDNVQVAEATRRGVMITNTPGVLTDTTADLAVALILAAARRITEAERYLREGRWKSWSPSLLVGRDVYGATLGLVGMGRIGLAVARRARGFNMRILYYNRRRDPEAEKEVGAEYRPLDDLLRESDFVSLHTPLSPETRGLIGERELALMKPTAILVNTARGPVVDERALYQALKERRIWAAGLDVFEVEPLSMDNPLLELDNVAIVPHIGSASIATRTKMAVMAAENLVAGVTGRRPPNLVNPEVWESHRSGSPGGPE